MTAWQIKHTFHATYNYFSSQNENYERNNKNIIEVTQNYYAQLKKYVQE